MYSLQTWLPNCNRSGIDAEATYRFACSSYRMHVVLVSVNRLKHVNTASHRDHFGENIDVSQLVEQEPLFLQVDISTVMQRLKLLLPKYRDPVAVLLANPRAVLDMEELGIPTAMDMGDI